VENLSFSPPPPLFVQALLCNYFPPELRRPLFLSSDLFWPPPRSAIWPKSLAVTLFMWSVSGRHRPLIALCIPPSPPFLLSEVSVCVGNCPQQPSFTPLKDLYSMLVGVRLSSLSGIQACRTIVLNVDKAPSFPLMRISFGSSQPPRLALARSLRSYSLLKDPNKAFDANLPVPSSKLFREVRSDDGSRLSFLEFFLPSSRLVRC